MTNDGAHSYKYDAANRLVSVDSGATAQYRYDHQNQRVTKIAGSSWTHYIWEGGRVIGEHDATTAYSTNPPYQQKSARLDYIYARGQMIHTRDRTSSTAPWTTRYYVSDVWSKRLVLDSSGNVSGRQGHLAFGEEFATSGTQEKHHFTNYESESALGTDYAVNRQYSQSVGRFGSADPYQASSSSFSPQSWNRYSYVENDPIHNVDPLGLVAAYPTLDPCCNLEHCGESSDDSTQTNPETNDFWTGFSPADYDSIAGASWEAFRLVLNTDCQDRLRAEPHRGRIVNVSALLERLLILPIKRIGEDTSVPGFAAVFNGDTSIIPQAVLSKATGHTAGTVGRIWIFLQRRFFYSS